MAPKAMKRPAAFDGKTLKKTRVVARSPVPGQCKEVAGSLRELTGLSDSVKRMLAASAEPALSQYKDTRHSHQVSVVGWIQEAFTAHQAVLEASAAEAKCKVDAVEADKGSCEVAVAAAEDALVKLHDAVADAKSKSVSAHGDAKVATAALKGARAAEKELETETQAASTKKQELEDILASEGLYGKMKVEVAKKKEVDVFVKTLRKHKFEAALLQTLSPVLAKEPSSRTDFDNLVLQNLDDAVAAQIAVQAKVVEDAAPGKAQRSGATAVAESAEEAAKGHVEAAEVVLAEAESAIKGGEIAVKDSKKALRACSSGLKDVAAFAKEAASALTDFCNGPLATFKELQERMTPVEEPSPPVEETPAEAPAGELEPEEA